MSQFQTPYQPEDSRVIYDPDFGMPESPATRPAPNMATRPIVLPNADRKNVEVIDVRSARTQVPPHTWGCVA